MRTSWALGGATSTSSTLSSLPASQATAACRMCQWVDCVIGIEMRTLQVMVCATRVSWQVTDSRAQLVAAHLSNSVGRHGGWRWWWCRLLVLGVANCGVSLGRWKKLGGEGGGKR